MFILNADRAIRFIDSIIEKRGITKDDFVVIKKDLGFTHLYIITSDFNGFSFQVLEADIEQVKEYLKT